MKVHRILLSGDDYVAFRKFGNCFGNLQTLTSCAFNHAPQLDRRVGAAGAVHAAAAPGGSGRGGRRVSVRHPQSAGMDGRRHGWVAAAPDATRLSNASCALCLRSDGSVIAGLPE